MAGSAFLGPTLGTTVNPASASRFSIAAPSDVSTGSAFSATITALDPYGNIATGYTGTVQFTSTDSKAVLPAPYTFTTGSGGDNGIHTFANGFTLNTVGIQTITATDKATSSITASALVSVVYPFLPPVSYGVGKSPVAVAVGDFDGDGTPDLAVANRDSGTVSVLLGKPDGTFQPAQTYAVGSTPVSVAVGDFNGDGKLDIVTASAGNGTVSVLLGKGDGTFQPALNYSLPSEAGLMQSPTSLAVGDFDKDGKLDVVLTAQTYTPGTYPYAGTFTGYINVLIGNGAGSFSADNIQTFSDPDPSSVAVGDFNGDGNPDLAVTASEQNSVSVLLGNGNGTFGNPTNYYTGIIPTSIAIGDVNGDGKLDLVTANFFSNSVSVFLGNGNGTFAPATFLSTGPNPESVAIADLNRDGKLDIVTANDNGSSSVSVLLGNGNGTFGTALNYPSGGTAPPAVAVGDFYPDGYPDLVVANILSNSVSVLLNPAQGLAHRFAVSGFPSPVTAGTAGNLTVTIENADGTTDANYTGTVHFTSSDPQAVLPADYAFTAADAGRHTFSATLKTAGTQSITATDTTATTGPGMDAGITVSNMIVAGFPSPLTAGVAGNFTVTLKDPDGTIATGYRGTIHFASSDPQAVLPADYSFTTADAGVHTFSAILKIAGRQSITAADTATPSFTGTQAGITINPTVVSALSVASFPSPTTAGVAGTFTVTARDAYGNRTGYLGTVHFTSNNPLQVLPADYTFTAVDAGMHTFSAILKQADDVYSLTVTDTKNVSLTGSQTGIYVNPGPMSTFDVLVPSPLNGTRAGVAYPYAVVPADAYGNQVWNYSGTVHFTSSDAQALLPADYTFTAGQAGVTFNVTLRTAGQQTITVTDAVNSSITATVIVTVNAAAASRFIIIALSSVTAGTPFGLIVKVEDAYGNVVTGYTGTVHFSSTDNTATLPKNYTFTVPDKGVHTFTGLVLRTRGNQTIAITDTLDNLTASVIVDVLTATKYKNHRHWLMRGAWFPRPC
jgi:hypothetical protein